MSKPLKIFQCEIDGKNVEITIYHVTSPQRKKMCLSYFPGQLKAFVKTAPTYCEKSVTAFVNKHLSWLKEQILKSGDRSSSKRFDDGVTFLFKGNSYKLEHHEAKKKKIEILNEGVCKIECPTQYIDRYMRMWMVEQTRLFAIKRSFFYAHQIKKEISDIKIKDVKTRWGSCSSLGNLNYNWRLIMVPEAVFDYVCAHEVAHLVHMNHSKDFWNLVQKFVTKEVIQYSKKWLEEHKKTIYQFG